MVLTAYQFGSDSFAHEELLGVLWELFCVVKHAFTHFKITLYAYECRYVGAIAPYSEPQTLGCQAWAWVAEDELERYSFGKADREIIETMKKRRGMLL